jgi:hypothetical protein
MSGASIRRSVKRCLARDAERTYALLSERFVTTTRLVLDFTDEAAGGWRSKQAAAARG